MEPLEEPGVMNMPFGYFHTGIMTLERLPDHSTCPNSLNADSVVVGT